MQLFADIRTDLDDLRDRGRMRRAATLSEATGETLSDTEDPMYFNGDLDAPFVLVHLNPKQTEDAGPGAGEPRNETLDEYYAAHRYFGARHYGPDPTVRHISPFDHKQIRFIRPFGVIDFTDDTRDNLRRVIDDKLQLELIPYASFSFSAHRYEAAVLRPHFERLMATITAHPRRYVIFCGSVFEKLLPPGSLGEQHAFHLPKADGSETKGRVRFANLHIPWDGQKVQAGLAHSWALQGIPMPAYGEAIAALYDATSGIDSR
jgi:hypothetical protein